MDGLSFHSGLHHLAVVHVPAAVAHGPEALGQQTSNLWQQQQTANFTMAGGFWIKATSFSYNQRLEEHVRWSSPGHPQGITDNIIIVRWLSNMLLFYGHEFIMPPYTAELYDIMNYQNDSFNLQLVFIKNQYAPFKLRDLDADIDICVITSSSKTLWFQSFNGSFEKQRFPIRWSYILWNFYVYVTHLPSFLFVPQCYSKTTGFSLLSMILTFEENQVVWTGIASADL